MRRWPEDVVRIANEVLAEIDDQQEVEYRLQSIMAAILAERQRCADIAEGFRQAHDTGSGFDSQPARETAGAIKDIILNPH